MNATTAVAKLLAWAQEELGARRALLEILGRHEAALLRANVEDIESTALEMADAASSESQRSERRNALLQILGRAWQVDPSTLTLRSIAERCGNDGERLARLRAELEPVVRDSARIARRVANIVRHQRGVARDVITALVGDDALDDTESASGQLLDARV